MSQIAAAGQRRRQLAHEVRRELWRRQVAAWSSAGQGELAWKGQVAPFQDRLLHWGKQFGDMSWFERCWAARVRGPIDPKILEQALARVVRRHDQLRARVLDWKGDARLEVLEIGPTLEVVPVAGADAAEQVAETIGRWVHEPLSLEDSPPWRFRLFVLGPEDHVLAIRYNEFCCDGQGFRAMLTELFESYFAVAFDQPPPDSLPVPFWTYVEWARRLVAEGGLEPERAFWDEQLKGVPPLALLGERFDRDRGPRPTEAVLHRGGQGLLDVVRHLSRTYGTTPVSLLATTAALWTARASGSRDLCVGLMTSLRPFPELQKSVGFFVYRIPIRVRFDPSSTVGDLVRSATQSYQDSLEHTVVPADGQSTRAIVGTPVTVNYLWRAEAPRVPGLDVEPFPFRRRKGHLPSPLRFYGQESDRAAWLWCEYQPELVEGDHARGILGGLVGTLHQLVTRAAEPLGSVLE